MAGFVRSQARRSQDELWPPRRLRQAGTVSTSAMCVAKRVLWAALEAVKWICIRSRASAAPGPLTIHAVP